MTGNADSKRIYFVVDDFMACGWYRAHVPGLELMSRGHEVMLDSSMTPSHVEQSDIVVFQRQWCYAARQAMDYAQRLGKLTVYELDDDLWNIHPTNPAYEAWNQPGVRETAEELIRAADVVTTTTEPLARTLRRFNSNVHILPNMLPQEHWHVQRERPEGYDKVAIGWAGSVSRWRDLAIVKEVGFQLMNRYPNVELVIAGDTSNMVFPPHPQLRQVNPRVIEQYPLLLAEFDVGIAPVVDSRFNQAKSDLKFLEYGMLGIPTVASNVEAYNSSIVNGENGFLAKNDKQWLKYLCRLVESPELREEIGAKAKALAESRTIDKNIGLWERAYRISAEEKAAS